MTTDAQNEANPANAQLGEPVAPEPRTEEGKAISSCLNFLKHGLTAAAVLLPGEELADSVLTRTRTGAGCRFWNWRWAAALVCAFTLAAQSKIDLATQSKNVDFSSASFTKPSRMGASLPTTCSQGETFFLTTAQAGSNFYICTTANTWSLPAAALPNSGVVAGAYGSASQLPTFTVNSQGVITEASTVSLPVPSLPNSGVVAGAYGSSSQLPTFTVNSQGVITGASVVPIISGGGGASQSSDLTDCKVSVKDATATVTGPCRLAIGSTVHILTGNATATLSGTSSSGTAYIYWDASGTMHVDQNSPATITCSALCATASNGTFPASSFPIATATFTANSFNGGTLTDLRSVYSYNPLVAGFGLTSTTDGNGNQHLSADTTSIATVLAAQSGSLVACNDTGTVNAIVCTPSQPLTGYATNMVLQVVPANTNTSGTMTINVSGLGNVTVKQADGVSNPAAGQSVAGIQVPWTYDGKYFRLPGNNGTNGSGSTGSAPYSCPVAGVSSIVCTHNLGTSQPWAACYDSSGNMLGSSGAATSVTSVVATSSNASTLTFSGTTTATCLISTGGMGPAGPTGAPGAAGSNGTNGAISQIKVNGVVVPVRPNVNIVGGANVTVTPSDNGSDTSTLTISATGGGSSTPTACALSGISTSGSIGNNSPTAVPFDAASSDCASGMWSAAHPTRLVAPSPGRYQFYCMTQWGATQPNGVYAQFQTNGSGAIYGPAVLNATGMTWSYPMVTASGSTVLAAGDYVECQAGQLDSASHTLYSAQFWGFKVD